MNLVSITIPGKPVAFARAGSNGVTRYTPEPQASYAKVIGLFAARAMSAAGYGPFSGPVEMIYRATFAWPAKCPEKRRKVPWKDTKSDLDNLTKLVADALNGIAYKDDAQIVSICAQKRYGETEGAVVTIAEIKEGVDPIGLGDLASRYPAPKEAVAS